MRSSAVARSTRPAGSGPHGITSASIAKTLAERPTWLFESGPCGDAAGQRHQTSPSVLRLAEDIGSAPPEVFGGNLDPARAKTRIARRVASSDLAGDYRNWDQIRIWADGIGRQVAGQAAG
jgi:menaquinone-dependent protoporphyrinogen oxidase